MPFRVPKIKGAFCCLSLETGSKIIGCIHMIFFVLGLSFPIMFSSWHRVVSILQAMIYESLFLNFAWCAVVMLYGTVKKDHVLLFPWIILQTVFFLFLLIGIFIQVVYFGLMDGRLLDTMIFETIVTLCQGYSMMIVYNHYRELKEQRPDARS